MYCGVEGCRRRRRGWLFSYFRSEGRRSRNGVGLTAEIARRRSIGEGGPLLEGAREGPRDEAGLWARR